MAIFDIVDLTLPSRDEILDALDALRDREEDHREDHSIHQALSAILRQQTNLTRKVDEIMADVSKLTDVVVRVAADVSATVTLLQNITSGDPAVQAAIDDAVAKLSGAADALESADTAATPPAPVVDNPPVDNPPAV